MKSALGKSVAFLLILLLAVHAASAKEKIKALIVDGQNNHNWKGTSPVLKLVLEESGRFTVDIATTPTKPEESEASAMEDYKKQMFAYKPDFAKYGVVIMNYNGDDWPEETQKAFINFVTAGGGLVIFHAANNAFPNWAEYNEMIAIGGWGGRNEQSGPYLYWEDGKIVRNTEPGVGGRHGPPWEFLIDVRESEHPIMKGLPKSFRNAKEELYDRLRGPAKNVTILATAFADTERGGSGRHEPILMVIDYKKGRVFHTCLGHSAPSCMGVSFIITFLRGTEWAATGKVTIPVPEDMPGTDKPVVRKFD